MEREMEGRSNEKGMVAMMKTALNDTRHVVWALGECFSKIFSSFFFDTNNLI